MRFIISETGWDYLERLMYRGCIGLFYETTLQGMLAYIIFALRRWTKGYTIKQPNMDCQPTEITALMRHRAVFS